MNRRKMAFYHNWAAQGKENIPTFSSSNPHRGSCFAPRLHILSLLPISIQLSQSLISRKEERGQTKYHRRIFVFHPKINAPCHFGKVLLDLFILFKLTVWAKLRWENGSNSTSFNEGWIGAILRRVHSAKIFPAVGEPAQTVLMWPSEPRCADCSNSPRLWAQWFTSDRLWHRA